MYFLSLFYLLGISSLAQMQKIWEFSVEVWRSRYKIHRKKVETSLIIYTYHYNCIGLTQFWWSLAGQDVSWKWFYRSQFLLHINNIYKRVLFLPIKTNSCNCNSTLSPIRELIFVCTKLLVKYYKSSMKIIVHSLS